MRKEELKRLKAGLLAVSLFFSLSACSKSSENKDSEIIHEKTVKQVQDVNGYLIVFIEGKAVIYEESALYSLREGYSAINQDYASMKFIQTPCIVLTGKDNCIKFASEIVGEENVMFMNFENGYDLILKPNN